MSKDWSQVELGDIFSIARGGSPRPIQKFLTDDPRGVNWIMISDATEGSKYITSTKKRIIPEGVSRSRMVSEGDFLLTNSMSFGKPYIMKTSGCIHDGWLVLSPNNEDINVDYFYHLLGSRFIYLEFTRRAAGATVKNLNINLVKSVQVPLPPLAEQQRIAAILDKADALRAKRRAALVRLDTLLQATFLEMFGDPVTNPMGWEVKPLEKVLSRKPQNGAYYPKEAYMDDRDLGIEMVHMSDAFYGIVKRGNLKRVVVPKTDIEKYGLDEHDILIARRSLNYEGSAKPCQIPQSTEPLIFESSLIRITPDLEQLSTSYLYHYLANERVRQTFIFPNVTRSTISGINQAGLKRIEVLVPERNVQAEFESSLEKLEILRQKMIKEETQLDNLFHSLQQRAFKGQLTSSKGE